jgi:hypothetical protein
LVFFLEITLPPVETEGAIGNSTFEHEFDQIGTREGVRTRCKLIVVVPNPWSGVCEDILFPPIRDDHDEPNSQADKIIPKLYVLGVWAKPWVLEGFETRAKAQYAINFQGGKPSDWAIAGRAGPDTFVMEEGRAFTVQRGPHSRKAFEAFKNEWLSRVASEAPKK